MEGLTTGRIVHYDCGSESFRRCRAAVVTEIWTEDGMVNLWVFDDGQYAGPYGVATSISHVDATDRANPSWHWPEKV